MDYSRRKPLKWFNLLVLVVALALGGCATTYPECEGLGKAQTLQCSEEAREYSRVETRADYLTCLAIYEARGYTWYSIHRGPVRKDRDGLLKDSIDQRNEMALNGCRLP